MGEAVLEERVEESYDEEEWCLEVVDEELEADRLFNRKQLRSYLKIKEPSEASYRKFSYWMLSHYCERGRDKYLQSPAYWGAINALKRIAERQGFHDFYLQLHLSRISSIQPNT